MNLSHLLFFSLCSISVFSKLEMVVEVFRHGAREPIFNYWNALSFQLPGELTSVGMRQHFLLGAQLRQDYIEDQQFLSKNYDPREIYVRSTDYNRTIMSALSQLSGLYPLQTGPMVPSDIPLNNTLPPYNKINYDLATLQNYSILGGFQPIPVHTVSDFEDKLLLGEHADICPINKKWFDEQKNSQLYQDIYREFENNTIASLRSVLNLTGNIDLGTISAINDVFLNDIFANKPLPNLPEETFKNMTYIYTMNLFYTYFGSSNQRKFIATPLFKEILNHFESKIQNKTTKKWVMYSAHDSTLGYVYSGLNISSYECQMQLWKNKTTDYLNCASYPIFASNLIIELHRVEEKFQIKIKVNGEYFNVCDRKEKECEWEEFSQRLNDFVLPNYEEVCHEKTNQISENSELVSYLWEDKNYLAESLSFLGFLFINAMMFFHLRRT